MTPTGVAWREDAALMAVAVAGGGLCQLLGLPAGWLTGAMIGVALVALRRPWKGPSTPLVDLGMLLSGAVVGAAATPEALAAAGRYPASLLLLLACLVVIVAATGAFLVRFGSWTRLDALLASAPGALSAVMAVAQDSSRSLPSIAIVQFFRLFVLIAAIPSGLVLAGVGAPVAAFAVAPPSWGDAAIMLAAGLALGLVLRRAGVIAPFVLGSTLASMGLHATGLVHGSLPLPLAILAFVIVGGMIGARLGGLDRAAMAKLMPLAVGAFVVSVAVAAIFAWPASVAAGVSYGAAFVAFAPGGLEAMAMLAVVLGFDPLYVGAHHLVRFLAVGLLMPVAIRIILSRGSG